MARSVDDIQLLNYDTLVKRIGEISGSKYLRDRAFIATLALGGFRIREVLGVRASQNIKELRLQVKKLKAELAKEKDIAKIKKLEKDISQTVKQGKKVKKMLEKNKRAFVIQPLKAHQVVREILNKKGKKVKFLKFDQMPILKRRSFKVPRKSPAVPYDREKELVLFVWRYVQTLKDNEVCFGFSRAFGHRIVKRCFGDDFFPHYLRHWRITRLYVVYGFNDQQVKRFIGSASVTSLEPYGHITTSDIMEKMI